MIFANPDFHDTTKQSNILRKNDRPPLKNNSERFGHYFKIIFIADKFTKYIECIQCFYQIFCSAMVPLVADLNMIIVGWVNIQLFHGTPEWKKIW